MVECTFPENTYDNVKSQESIHPSLIWTLNICGYAGTEHVGAGFILEDPDGHQFAYAIKFNFLVSNNEPVYEALLSGLQMEKNLKRTHLLVSSDPR